MRIVFCGSGDFGKPSLEAILAAGHEVVGVVTQPPRPAGRGGKLRATPIAELAQPRGLAVLELPKINAPDAVDAIRALRPDVIFVVDYGQMVRSAVRDSAPLGAFNLHGSLLPELRGAAPVNWAILRGHQVAGVTTFSLVDAMDAGDMYLQASLPIDPAETAVELRARLAQLGAGVVCDTLQRLAAGSITAQKQDESKVTLAPRLTKADGVIDWSQDAHAIRCRVHGCWPWPGGQALFHGQKQPVPVTIARVEALPDAAAGEPGTLDKQLTVSAGRGRLRILELQPAGKRLMGWRDFVNGHRVGPDDRFTTVEQHD